MFAIETIAPMGVRIEGSGDLRAVAAERLREWIEGERLVVFRGFDALSTATE